MEISGLKNAEFDFRINYKVLQRREAIVRFGLLRNDTDFSNDGKLFKLAIEFLLT